MTGGTKEDFACALSPAPHRLLVNHLFGPWASGWITSRDQHCFTILECLAPPTLLSGTGQLGITK